MKMSTLIMGPNWKPPQSKMVLVGQVLVRVFIGVLLGALWAALGYLVITGGDNPFGASAVQHDQVKLVSEQNPDAQQKPGSPHRPESGNQVISEPR